MAKNVYIAAVARTPIGSFREAFKELQAPELGSVAIKGALERSGIPAADVEQVIFGHVLQAGTGQHPTKQAALGAGIPHSVPCTTVNKVCASGTKAIIFAAQQIQLGEANVVVAGGMESMSNTPYYLARGETPYGGVNLKDSLVFDGLTDTQYHIHMGNCAEHVAKKYGVTREDQDAYAIESYKKSEAAFNRGDLAKEIVPVTIKGKRGKPDKVVTEDEEFRKVVFDKLKTLNTVFQREGGTVTAGNASTLNDGAAACVLVSDEAVAKYGLTPLAKIVSYADAALDPILFPVAPVDACKKAVAKANLTLEQIDLWELNEAFSVVGLANTSLLGLDSEKVNRNGGAVSLGHPLGCSGARIVNCLALHLAPGQFGCAGVCNGGGGASAMVVQKL